MCAVCTTTNITIIIKWGKWKRKRWKGDDKEEEGNGILYTTQENPCKYALWENETLPKGKLQGINFSGCYWGIWELMDVEWMKFWGFTFAKYISFKLTQSQLWFGTDSGDLLHVTYMYMHP